MLKNIIENEIIKINKSHIDGGYIQGKVDALRWVLKELEKEAELQEEIIKLLKDMYYFLDGMNNGFLRIKISNGRNIEDLKNRFKKWEEIIK